MTYTAAKQWIGQPVCLLLDDGSYCIGTLETLTKKHVTLSQATGSPPRHPNPRKRKSKKRAKKRASTSGLFGPMPGFAGGGPMFGGYPGLTPFGYGGRPPMGSPRPGGPSFGGYPGGPLFGPPGRPPQGNPGGTPESSATANPSGAGAAGGMGGLFNTVNRYMPMIKIGMNVVKSIWPLVGMLSI
ncbi:hypothetical protein ACH6EH_09240 [Paenibacillus sp. JSM ZJ436]|uniref:hypothetical protein n=1 Tax=Paenibacillus sp. JSM ZJ436 TaxID=3376190 RepID=UPI0037875DE2